MSALVETARELAQALREARERTLAAVADLDARQLIGPQLAIVNPPLWELAHVAWFQEHWVLRRRRGMAPWDPAVDALYDSTAVPHERRWELELFPLEQALAYGDAVLCHVTSELESAALAPDDCYFQAHVLRHESMHVEALLMMRQALGYAAPHWPKAPVATGAGGTGDASLCDEHVAIPGGQFRLGREPGSEGFAFDNEKWAHEVVLAPFRIARAPVSQARYAEFVEAGGYGERELWSDAGWAWRASASAEMPVYWRRATGGGFERRLFDRWIPLEPDRPVHFVCAHEAEAYCRWRGLRLPTEAEWELAATAEPEALAAGTWTRKRRFPWGDGGAEAPRANLDRMSLDPAPIGACAAGDSAHGCRQMIGNVWEWTASDFAPYPGFAADAYAEYSQPWFGTHRVLRGGSAATRGRLVHSLWRNFYRPERRDVLAGFRTIAR